MESILENLYYGEISPCSRPTPTTERFLQAKEEVGQYEKALLAKYSDCKELLKSYAGNIKGGSQKRAYRADTETLTRSILQQLARDCRILNKASSSEH